MSDEETHELVQTRSGHLAVRSRSAGEVMHPGVGPRVEAEQLYVRQSGLPERLRPPHASVVAASSPGSEVAATASAATAASASAAAAGPPRLADPTLTVFDVGLGAGSNAVAALRAAWDAPAGGAVLELVSFERDLGALRLALSRPQDFSLDGEAGVAAQALLARGRYDSARVTWRLERDEILPALARQRAAAADIVFWDPFSPRANPELWTVAAFTAIRDRASGACLLVTYSASTAVRVALLLAGWAVGVGAPTGDKGATTMASPDAALLERPLDRRWLGRLDRADVPLPPDAPRDFAQRIAALPQFS